MSDQERLYPQRGSAWRQWDLHIHTPSSFHWKGKRFANAKDVVEETALIDAVIKALNESTPAVFALMDYWTFDGWFRLKKRLKEVGAPKLLKTVFPGIELRLTSPMDARLNAHVIFSDKIPDQELHNFNAALRLELTDDPLSEAGLIKLARLANADYLNNHGGHKLEAVKADDALALRVGCEMATVKADSYRTAISRVPNGHAIGFMPFDTNDGLAHVNWQQHYAFVLSLFHSSPIFETRNFDTARAFANETTDSNQKYIKNFQSALNDVPRLAVSGSDAHQLIGKPGDNNNRGYGDFPSAKITWIKADPTFEGLLQAIKEPAKRSFIGDSPSKLAEVWSNQTYYIESLEIDKQPGSALPESWLHGCRIPLNTDLVAIIGKKGSGKSALADIIALLGYSRQREYFSFLKSNRFRGKSGEPAKHFDATLRWLDTRSWKLNLNEDPGPEKVELVRYIPQGHFEALCNEHVTGSTNAFERELQAVIFSHLDEIVTLGALDFDQLVEQQEGAFRDQLTDLRGRLSSLNGDIANYEAQLDPVVRARVQEELALKNKQIEQQTAAAPAVVPPPPEKLTPEQKSTTDELENIGVRLQEIINETATNAAAQTAAAGKLKAVQNIRARLVLLQTAHKEFIEKSKVDAVLLGVSIDNVASLKISTSSIDLIASSVPLESAQLTEKKNERDNEKLKHEKRQAELKSLLNAPQLKYQNYLAAQRLWAEKLAELIGTDDSPSTQKGLTARLHQLDALPDSLSAARKSRGDFVDKIFDVLEEQRLARAQLFKPVQDLIQANSVIRTEYKLQFKATLAGSLDALSASLFSLIKQNAGEFRGGDDDSFAAVRQIAAPFDLSTKAGSHAFVDELLARIIAAKGEVSAKYLGVAGSLRKDKLAIDVYDLLFGLSFLQPRYSLLFQETGIEQLSPGQRGALLLIFYLLVDKGRNPIILDQPEENLDNETVVSLLVPVLSEAKKRRQILMVTHNPNLAVVCDAEQIIHATFDRTNGSLISYLSGSIENPSINTHVVNVLEGTKVAFDNRGSKYLVAKSV